MSKINDREKGLVVSIMFLVIALSNMIFYGQVLYQNHGWCAIVFIMFFVGIFDIILTTQGKRPTLKEQSTPIKGAIKRLKVFINNDSKYVDKIGKAYYGIADNGIFGARIVAGIVTGVRLTDDKPVYEISFEKNSWWVTDITDDRLELLNMLKVSRLSDIEKTSKIKLKHHD